MFNGLLHMDTPVIADQQKLTFIGSVQTLDAFEMTSQEQLLIGMDGKRVSKESVLLTSFEDDNTNLVDLIIYQVHCAECTINSFWGILISLIWIWNFYCIILILVLNLHYCIKCINIEGAYVNNQVFDVHIIMSCHQHGYPWPSLATSPYHSSPPAGLQGYILCPHIAAVCKFKLVVLLLLGHMWGSIGVHHLWARPCFSSSVLRVWFI